MLTVFVPQVAPNFLCQSGNFTSGGSNIVDDSQQQNLPRLTLKAGRNVGRKAALPM
jgi:hypothetical protein